MKKLLFAAYDMNVGGIETSLLTLLNTLIEKDYEITLVLEKKQGAFLKDLDSNIHVIEYKPCDDKMVLIRKLLNLIKRIRFMIKYKNKFDFAASYATYSKMSSFVARTASSNNALWVHADYLALSHGDFSKMEEFFKGVHVQEFKHIVFVSQASADTFTRVFQDQEEKVMVCNNVIDDQKIQNLAQEKIEETKRTYTFVNVGRHDERQKRLTRILEATQKLKKEQYDFEVWFIGEGEDTYQYKQLVEEYQIQPYIKFLGVKKNPYPYMKLADSIILSSDYEGYPVVFLEAFILNKPILTTDISDAKNDIENKFGKVVKKEVEDIYKTMKEFIEKGYTIKEKFHPKEYNNEMIEKIEDMINK